LLKIIKKIKIGFLLKKNGHM